jgi:NAD(P)-dependent dehydrogenase (short-subunit alcohol dehydrogenase family)
MNPYVPPEDLLADRVILVTGAATGIGRAAASVFAQHGATLVLLDRQEKALEQTYDAIEQAGGAQPAIIALDLAKASLEHYQALQQQLEQELGRLDGLLHNAAELGELAPLELYNLELWSKVFTVNVHAPLLLTRACLPLLRKSQDASIIFTTADVGRKGRAYWGAYGVTCFALEGLMQILAEELEANTNIRVNSLDPGAVQTAMRARAYPAENRAGLLEPAAIMAQYLYLMGPDSKGITGKAHSAQEQQA